MSPESLPSPLSIGPPRRDLLPKPAEKGKAMEETINTAATDPLPTVMIPAAPSSTETIIGRNMCVLAEFMKPRPANARHVRVIAVDGIDRLAVHANLQHRITRDLQYAVRVVSEDCFYPPDNQPSELSQFIRQVQTWGAMWDLILHAPSISSSSFELANPTHMHADYPVTPTECPR